MNLPSVSFVIPHLGYSETRVKGLQACLNSIYALNYPPELISIFVMEGEETVPEKVKTGVKNSAGEWICYMANDTVMSPDSLMIALTAAALTRKRLVAFHSEDVYPDGGNACAHFVIKRSLIPLLVDGLVFHTDFHHVGCDNFLHAQGEKLNEFIHCEEAIIEHNHFSKGAEMDDVYKKGWSHVEEDRETLRRKLATL